MGNIQMEADQIRYRGQYRNVQEALENGGGGGGTTVVANPEGSATADLNKLQVGESVYGIPSTAAKISYDNTDSGLTADDVQGAIDEMVVNFQDGVDDVYDACVAKGSTPASHSLSDVITAIGNISGGGLTQINPFGAASTITPYNANGVTVLSSSVDSDGTGALSASEASAGYEGFVIELDVTAGKTYLVAFDLQVDDTAVFNGDLYRFGYLVGNAAVIDYGNIDKIPENMARDFLKHHYAGAIVATGSKAYINFNVCGFSDGTTNNFALTDIKVYEVEV